MKKIALFIVLSLSVLGHGCQQNKGTGDGYGAENGQYQDDNQTGAGQIDESGTDMGGSSNGGTMNNTTSTTDTMQTPEAVGEDQATRATEKTQTEVGNSNTIGDENHSKSQTTKNKTIK